MNHPTTRVLAILELLQARGRVSGAELAQRIEVDRRTIRRYIAMLEDLGIPITTERGSHGGYELVAGFKLPPLMFSNDEALALALGLAAARGFGLADTARAVSGAQAKLERVMPPELKHRMRSITESIAVSQRQPPDSPADTSTLSTLSTAAHRKEGVRLCYRAASGSETVRDFDPYGLAFNAGHWYAVGYCGLRKGLRSFRLDRVRSVDSQPRQFEKPERFDVLDHLTSSIATMPRRFAVEVHLKTTLESAKRELFQAIGVLEPLGDGVLLRGQADDLQWFARELARLPWPFEMIRPAALVRALDEHARTLLKQTASSKSARSARSR